MLIAITPKDWARFQHYKDRQPPWIKLYTDLIDNFEYQSLPVASRALAPQLWCLASKCDDARIELSAQKLAWRLRCDEKWLVEAVKPLISEGFFIALDGCDSELLAPCKRDAILETETETEEKNIPSGKSPDEKQKAAAKQRREARKAAKRLLEALNQAAGKNFKAVEANISKIETRLKDYTEDEVLQVIRAKSKEWRSTEMDRYLRPETLFQATKFDAYLQEARKPEARVPGQAPVAPPKEKTELEKAVDKASELGQYIAQTRKMGREPDEQSLKNYEAAKARVAKLRTEKSHGQQKD